MRKIRHYCFGLVLALLLFNQPSFGQKETGFLNPAPSKGAITCQQDQVKHFTVVVHSPTEKREFLARKRIHDLIEETWHEDADGKLDAKRWEKYREILDLANELPHEEPKH